MRDVSSIVNEYFNGDSTLTIGMRHQLSSNRIGQLLKRAGVVLRSPTNRCRRHQLNEAFFDRWNPCMAYWLGFLCADGTLKKNGPSNSRSFEVSLQENDVMHLYKLRDALETDYVPKTRIRKSGYGVGNGYCKLTINSCRLVTQLERLGFAAFKNGRPTLIEQISSPYFSHWLRGMSDGDGWITKRYIGWGLTDRYKTILEAIGTRLQSFVPGHYGIYKNNSAYKLFLSRRRAVDILKFIYRDVQDQISLDRKRIIYEACIHS
jgi:hypothetical protein